MWKRPVTSDFGGQFWQFLQQPQICGRMQSLQLVRNINSGELGTRYKLTPKVGWWRRRGTKLIYPTSHPSYMRKIGVDLNLQQRLEAMFAKEQAEIADKRVDIGFPAKESASPLNSRKEMLAWRKEQRSNKELEKAARQNTLDVNMADVKQEHEATGGLYEEIYNSAEFYGIFEDLFDGAYFKPVLNLSVEYDYDEDTVTPVYRGNIIKPKEATTAPHVHYECGDDKESLWTLLMTNPDGHFTEDNSEYFHWMVANIKANDLTTGQTVIPYLQPFPAMGSGYHRHIFILFKQNGEIDASKYVQPQGEIDLAKRTFKTKMFFDERSDQITPAGMAFFQSDWDSSLTNFYHNVLNMREPRYEYNFAPYYTTPWNELTPRHEKPFNLFLDTKRDPKEIQEEVLKKKLKRVHPFKGQLDGELKFPNAHGPQRFNYRDEHVHGTWRLREIERERLRQGVYKDMDWTALRQDPTNA